MQLRSKYFSAITMLILCIGQTGECQEFKKSKPSGNYPPRSLFDIFGVYANTSPDLEWQNRFITGTPAISIPLPLIASNANISGGPAGTEEMLVYRNAGTSHCVTATVYPAFATVFDYTFTTGPGTKYLQVIYSTQANVNNGAVGVVDGPALQCRVTQGATTVPCSNSEQLPFVIARNSDGKGNSVVTTYSGYVAVDPSTSTRVRIEFAVAVSGTIAKVCDNNLILRY